MLINTIQNPKQNSNLILQTSNPRPIAWIVTEDKNGVINIAPYSLFTPLSFDPATLIVSFRAKEDGSQKDTLNNIHHSKKCTICMVKTEDMESMHKTSQEIPSSESEAQKFEIETQTVLEDFPPIISSSPIAYFCEFSQEITLEAEGTIPLILTIKEIFVDDDIIKNRDSLEIKFDGVGHIVGDRYSIKE